MVRPVASIAICLALLLPYDAAAETYATGGGVSFDVPEGWTPISGQQAPIAISWRSTTLPITGDVILLEYAGDPADTVREFLQWPEAGQAVVEGSGNAVAETLGTRLKAPCSSSGVPIAHDPKRHALWVQLDTSCATLPKPTKVRSHFMVALTRSAQVMVRVDARNAGFREAEAAAAGIWVSLRVDPAHRVVVPEQIASAAVVPGAESSAARAETGITVPDYRRVNPWFLLGRVVGATLVAVFLGWILASLLLRWWARPLPVLFTAQALIFAMQVWREAHDGVWKIDWLGTGAPGLLAVAILYKWANGRAERSSANPGLP